MRMNMKMFQYLFKALQGMRLEKVFGAHMLLFSTASCCDSFRFMDSGDQIRLHKAVEGIT